MGFLRKTNIYIVIIHLLYMAKVFKVISERSNKELVSSTFIEKEIADVRKVLKKLREKEISIRELR